MPVEVADLNRIRDEIIAGMRVAFGEWEARVGSRFDTLAARIDASEAETRRHMDVIAERLTVKIALLAESVNTCAERLAGEMRHGFDIVDRRLLSLESRLNGRAQANPPTLRPRLGKP